MVRPEDGEGLNQCGRLLTPREASRATVLCAAVMMVAGGLGCGCGGDVPVVDVRLSGVPATAHLLRLSPTLDGKPALAPLQLDLQTLADPGRFGLSLPAGSSGTLVLVIEALLGDSGDLIVARGQSQGTVNATATLPLQVALAPLSPLECTDPAKAVLSLQRSGAGSGALTSAPPGLDCGATCAACFPRGATITLTASPAPRTYFAGWTQGCTGFGISCPVSLSTAVTVSGAFEAQSCTANFCLDNRLADGTTAGDDFNGVWGSGPGDVWAVGAAGALLHYDGHLWRRLSAGTQNYLKSVWVRAPGDVFAVGILGTVLHTGTTTAPITAGTATQSLSGVSGSGAEVWAVGDGGTVLHGSGSQQVWATVPVTGSPGRLLSVWVSQAGKVWAVGEGGTVVSAGSGGLAAAVIPTAAGAALRGITGLDSGSMWAVGSAGTILYSQAGGAWTVQGKSVTTSDLNSIWARAQSDIWAVGAGGAVLRFDGINWGLAAAPSPTTRDLYAVWGSGPGDVWLVGQNGTLLHYLSP